MSFLEFLDAPPFPKFVQFETATNCNARCLMCPHDKMKRQGTAKWSLISKVIRESASKVDAVCPFLMQEPFLEKRLINILANVKQRNRACRTIVYSNMSVVPEDVMHKMLETDLLDELHISFYGPTEALYEKWQPPLKREVTVANIKRFFEMRKSMRRIRPRISLHVLAVPELVEAVKEGYKDVAPFVDEILNVQYDTFHGDIPDLAGDQTKYMGYPKKRTPCQRLWTGMNIHYDGSVVPCCIDYNDENVLGNVGKDSLEEVWSGLNFQKFRRLHMDKQWDEIAMCRECHVHEYQFSAEWVAYWLSRE